MAEAELAKCKSCGKEVAKTAPTCPECGETFPGLRIKCPACGSMSIAVAGQKGFGLGTALATGFVLGPAVGLLLGAAGRKDIQLQCKRCGTKWDKPRNLLQ